MARKCGGSSYRGGGSCGMSQGLYNPFFQNGAYWYGQGGSDPSVLAAEIYTNHSTRVLADGGVIEDEARTKSYLETIITAFSITSEAQFKTKFPVSIDPEIFGYKVGTGSGATLGWAATKLYSINENGDVVQATAASQPLLLTHTTGNNYYWASRVTNNTISTPAASFTFTAATDELQITAKIFAGAVTASNESIAQLGSFCNFRYTSNGTTFSINFRGTANAVSSSNYVPSQVNPHWVRLVINPSGASYFWSADGNTYTNIGNVALPTMGTVGTLVIGTGSSGTGTTKFYSVEYRNNTTAQVTTCDPNSYDRTASETSWTAGGVTWTINMDTGTTGLKGLLVDRTIAVGNGTSFKISNASIALNQPNTNYVLMRRLGTGQISGRAASVGISHDATNITINNGAALSVANTGKLRQMLTAVYNGATSSMQINNGVRTDGNSGSTNGTYLDLFANDTVYGNFIIEGFIVSDGADTEAQRTAMYDLFFLNESDPLYDNSYFWGAENLLTWLGFKANPATQLNMVFMGDSWIYTPYRFAQDIVAWAKAQYGNAGAGFTSAADLLPYEGASVSRTGTWVDSYDKSNGIGINKTHSNSTVVTSTIVYTPEDAETSSYEIFYIKQLNGGTFSYKIGAGSKTNVATANATTEIGYVTVSGSQALTIEVEVAGTAGVSIIGAIFKNANNGVRAHKCGMSGINAVELAQGNNTYYQSQISQLQADIVFILLGSNDMNGNIRPSTSAQGMEDIATRIRAARPNCDIVFCGSGSNGLADKTYTIDDYQRAYYAVAKENDYTFVNLARVTGNYTDANAAGYYEDNLHVNTPGGTLLANSVIDILQ